MPCGLPIQFLVFSWRVSTPDRKIAGLVDMGQVPRMPIITIVSQGTLGDHFPFLALGEALVARGHTIRYLGPSHLAAAITECGMEAWPFCCDVNPEHVRANPASYDHWSSERGGFGPNSGAESADLFSRGRYAEKLKDLMAAASGSDLLLCSRLLPIGQTISELTGVPWVTACVVPWFYPSPGTAAAKGIEAREEAEKLRPMMRTFAEQLNAWRKNHGLNSLAVKGARNFFEASRILLATSPLFGTPEQEPGREIVQTGFWLHTPPGWRNQDLKLDAKNWLDGCEEPPMVLSFSSQPLRDAAGFLDLHLAAARLLGKRLVVQGGWAEWESQEFARARAEGWAIRLPAGPQESLFQRAGVVIHHGGVGTTARALLAAAPQLVEPHGNDQFYNARQVMALGAGAAVNPHRLTAEGLASVLQREVFTEKRKTTAHRLAEAMASEPGVRHAVRQLERWLNEV